MRGTVAGEPVVSQAATEEYREGHARTFGEQEPKREGGRRRFVWDGEKFAQVSADWEPTGRSVGAPVSDLYMDGVAATDGTDIGSRRKRRDYMRRNNLADADDYKNTWAQQTAERIASREGTNPKDHAAVKEAVIRAASQLRNRR